jgi:hypothetical protein
LKVQCLLRPGEVLYNRDTVSAVEGKVLAFPEIS